jgi:hypothetical protein
MISIFIANDVFLTSSLLLEVYQDRREVRTHQRMVMGVEVFLFDQQEQNMEQ